MFPLDESGAKNRSDQRLLRPAACRPHRLPGRGMREGDCLIVAINSDDSIRRLDKAPDRPIFDAQYRSQMLAGLESVDYVVVFDEDTPHAILRQLEPDVLVKGGTYQDDEIVGGSGAGVWRSCQALGMTLVVRQPKSCGDCEPAKPRQFRSRCPFRRRPSRVIGKTGCCCVGEKQSRISFGEQPRLTVTFPARIAVRQSL